MSEQQLVTSEKILEKITLEIQKLQDENSKMFYELTAHKSVLGEFVKIAEELKNEQRFDFEDVVYKFKETAELLLN